MKILNIEIENFKSITDLSANLNGRSLLLTGKNGTGKSSFIQAIWSPLTGEDIPMPLTKEQHKGQITLDIGEEQIEYTLNYKYSEKDQKGKLTVTTPENEKVTSPRSFLKNLTGNIAFDPFDFIRTLEKEKKKGIALIKEILGLDFSELDEKHKELYDERTGVNREVKNLEGVINNLKQDIKDFKAVKEIDTTELEDKISNAAASEERYSSLQRDQEKLSSDINKIDEEISELEAKIVKLKEQKEDATEELNSIKISIENFQIENVDELKEELNKARQHNAQVQFVSQYGIKKDELRAKTQEAENLTEQLEGIVIEKKKQLSQANANIEGLEISEEGIYYKGLPFEQLNKSLIISIGLKLGKALHNKMSIMRIEDGSLLDNETLKEVMKFAEENNLQMFIEKVDGEKGELQLQYIEPITS